MPSSRPPKGRGGRGHAAAGPSQRQLRAGELVRHSLAEVLREEEVQDPALKGVSVTVTEVRPSPDLRHATVFVEPLGGAHAGEVVEALNRASRFLRGALGRRIDLKFTPDLHFVHDPSFDTAAHMNALFAKPEVQRDLAPSEALPLEGGGLGGGVGTRSDERAREASPEGHDEPAAHTPIPDPSPLEGEGRTGED